MTTETEYQNAVNYLTKHHLVSSAQQLLAESPWHCRS